MNHKKSIVFLMLLIIPFIFISCCNCGSENETYLNGKIVVVGNEPFAKLALEIENNKLYILEGDELIIKELWKQQGNNYSVMYKQSRVESGLPILVIEKALPLSQEKK
ncbi:MAG: hypothetical protein FJ214_08460 [Ignavibacteria bacterium]|nr:hypothetical protein [Ignavibacteria bacterium]